MKIKILLVGFLAFLLTNFSIGLANPTENKMDAELESTSSIEAVSIPVDENQIIPSIHTGTQWEFGGKHISFPKDAQIQFLKSQYPYPSKSPLDLKTKTKEEQVAEILNEYFESNYSTIYQVVVPTENGIKNAFWIEMIMTGNDFRPEYWEALYPHSSDKSFLDRYFKDLANKAASNHPEPTLIFENEQSTLSISTSRFTHPEQFRYDIQTQSGSLLIKSHPIPAPVYYRYHSWKYQEDYYLTLIVSLDGEQPYWESMPYKIMDYIE